ncbi:hypothetical protein [Sphingomonas sp. VNH70]|uniref:alpha/beta hydrolase family protein n=1 Tax=Sphingomonas silueang TaxID=3156617 RepID=UPI0032B33CA9
MRWPSLLPLALLAACGGGRMAHAPAPGAQAFGPDGTREVKTLALVLHGDGDTVVPAAFAEATQAIAAAIPGTRAVALLRPGYADGAGNSAPGVRGGTTGDAWTRDRLDAVADTIAAWRARYPHARTVLIGQSGGAAMAALLAGLRPGLVDGVVLAGCPCMLPEWRRYRARHGGQGFRVPVTSFDPLLTVGGIAPATKVAVLVGAEDAETPQRFSRAYAEALALRGIATDYRVLPGRGHDLLGDGDLIEAVRRIASPVPRNAPAQNAMVNP